MGTSGRHRRDRRYAAFRRLDGSHPLRRAAPGSHVDYRARRVRGARVIWFHFALARDMGLIPRSHPSRLNQDLHRALCDTFGLVIINEYDQAHRVPVSAADRLPGTYMATRYLQIQHPDRRGTTSGDGRSIWNGTFTSRGRTWDVSSCGTGVTRLCPATAEQHRFFRTGSTQASYGCGTASVQEGLDTLLMSEAMHRNGIATERVLAILGRPDGYAIVVRAAPNLIRPSHLFAPLKQGALERLRGVADHFIRRQIDNGVFPRRRTREARYRHLEESTARTFARLAATFESEYIFCWLDWDGDNILADGGIIDYGSVRQFGLYHREYRFDDGPRWSTTIPEQRRKARLIAQNFAQIVDFLITGIRSPLKSFAHGPVLALFDAEFATTRLRKVLERIGYPRAQQSALMAHEIGRVERFRRAHAWFERARSGEGPQPVPDGLTWNAIFSTRDLLREVPRHYARHPVPIDAQKFLAIAVSTYASRQEQQLTPARRRQVHRFQAAYLDLLHAAARRSHRRVGDLAAQIARRSAIINRRDRLTGDAVYHASRRLLRARPKLTVHQFQRIIEHFVADQSLIPEIVSATDTRPPDTPAARRVLDDLASLKEEFREGL